MSFDPEKVQLVEFCELCLNLYIEPRVSYADYEKLLQLYRDQTSLLHDVSTEADPAGTLRELRLAQDTIKALEARIAELEELSAQKESSRDIAFEDAAIHIELLQLEPREDIAAHYAKCIRALKTKGEGPWAK